MMRATQFRAAFWSSLAIGASLCASSMTPAARSAGAPRPAGRPNIILVTVDSLRADEVSPYRFQPSASPALARLRAGAVLFEHAITQAPSATTSIASLMTGVYPALEGTGHTGAARPAGQPRSASLAAVLGRSGYLTLGVTADPTLAANPEVVTGLEHVQSYERAGADYERVANTALGQLQSASHERPIFIWVHIASPAGSSVGDHDAQLAAADAVVWNLERGLESAGFERAPVTVVAGARGQAPGTEGGSAITSLRDQSLRVPLLIKAPGLTPRVVWEQVRLMDVFPTLADLGGALAPELDGQSLVGLMAGLGQARDAVSVSPDGASLRAEGWKLIARTGQPNELYDLSFDPNERHNLAAAQPERAARLLARLHRNLDRVGQADAPPPAQAPSLLARLQGVRYPNP